MGYRAPKPQPSPAVGYADVYLYRPINLADPVGNGTALIRFSVDLAIFPSNTAQKDRFGFVVFNSDGFALAGIDFSTNSGFLFNVVTGYAADGTARNFEFGGTYKLVIDIDYSTKMWSATIQGGNNNQYPVPTPIFQAPKSIANGLTKYDLGDIDAVWTLQNTNTPGNNYMIFDNYSITVTPVPTLSIAQTSNDPTFTLSWPSSTSNWTLQQSPSLTTPSWVSPTTPTTVVSGQNQVAVTLSSSDSRMFFRLTPP